ncbi:MAG: hypothetical protein JRN15_15605 [Nitrososphaerota archaeon]|nr:hypothetical protein [Nitrososphaerota archaeon]
MNIGRLHEVRGSNFEMGYEHGAIFGSKIKSMVDELLQKCSRIEGVTKDSIYRMTEKYVPFIEKDAPHIIEEMRGIAEGSNVSYYDILFVNLRHEILNGLIRARDDCTVVGVEPSRSSTGNLMVAQNVDQPGSFAGMMQTLKMRPNDGPSMLVHLLPGNVGQHGINAYGLVRASNGLKSTDEATLGLPRVILNRLILEQKNVDDAVELISNSRRTVSSNYVLGDSSGRLVSIESTAHECRIILPTNGAIVHANNILHPDIRDLDARETTDSPKRYESMKRIVFSHAYKVNINDLCSWLRDHTNYPESICNHSTSITVASIIYLPMEQELRVAGGNPCVNEYLEYS